MPVTDSMRSPNVSMPAAASVSVIIPTVNRVSMNRSLGSALAQGPLLEVLIVDDSPAQDFTPPIDDARVRVIRSGGRVGAAQARNLGMRQAEGGFIAFLDDDDEWFDDHLETAVAVLNRRPDRDIYAARAFVRDTDGNGRVEPVSLLRDESFCDYTYGRSSLVTRGRRVITPTLVFRSALKDIAMQPELTWAEDTWWLLTAERRGHRIHQDERVGALVYASAGRRRDREADEANLDWARRLEAYRPRAGAFHLALMARTAAKKGRTDEVARRAREARTLSGSARLMPVFALEMGLAAAVAARNRLRPHS